MEEDIPVRLFTLKRTEVRAPIWFVGALEEETGVTVCVAADRNVRGPEYEFESDQQLIRQFAETVLRMG